MKLPDLQGLFWEEVTHPGDPQPEVSSAFIGNTRLGATERVRIYADMYLVRLRDVLQDDFPALHRVLGDETFFGLTDAFLRQGQARV